MTDPSAIRKLIEGVTEGPWEVTDGVVWVDTREQVCCGRGYTECCGEPDVIGGQEKIADASPADARFIAAARTLVPEMPVLIEALRAAEWGASTDMEDACCPVCGLTQDLRHRWHADPKTPHAPDCKLGNALARIAELEAGMGNTVNKGE